MGKALYRTYRSLNFDDLVGQDEIIETLKNEIKTNRLSHAYIFAGPRGVGKTSIARIFAHQINKIKYENEDNVIDIIEIDGASNRGIDEIRFLREKAHFAPSHCPYKVYIIDEVHMLTTPAFNALLKILEEPPEHVIFILATTDYEKIPITITSRTQKFFFKLIPKDLIIQRLKKISLDQKITCDDQALEAIATMGDGSLRDSISLFDQVISNGQSKIDLNTVNKLLGIPLDSQINKLLDNIFSLSINTLIEDLNKIFEDGKSIDSISKAIHDNLLQRIINHQLNQNLEKTIDLLKNLLIINNYSDPQKYLQLCLIEYQDSINQKDAEVKIKPNATVALSSTEKTEVIKKDTVLSNYNQFWNNLLENLKKSHNTLYGILRMSTPKFYDNNLELKFKFKFHQKRIQEKKNHDIISSTIEELAGQKFNIICLLETTPTDQEKKQNSNNDDQLIVASTIKEIFPEAERL